MNRKIYVLLIFFSISIVISGCGRPSVSASDKSIATLAEARKGFTTKIVRQLFPPESIPTPPSKLFDVVDYNSPVGKLAAYLTPDPKDGKKHPAIIWITGGDCNSIGDVWSAAPVDNDQTASAFREAGISMMYPSLRGGNRNPGQVESFFGEVNDILAAADYLAKQKYIDPKRIYLGGHSTGGTLVLLVAEYSNRFRAIFSFGPVANTARYGIKYLAFDTSSRSELELRAPGKWLQCIKSPVFVIEGMQHPGNYNELLKMQQVSSNPLIHFIPVSKANHFSTLYPVTRLLAKKVLGDDGQASEISITNSEVDALFN